MPNYKSKTLPSPVFPDDEARRADERRWAEREHLLQPRACDPRYEADLMQYQRSLRAAQEERQKKYDLRVDGRITPEQARRLEAERTQDAFRKQKAVYERLTPDGALSDAAGKLWAAPLTIAGAVAEGLNVLGARLAGDEDARITFGNNAIQFESGLVGGKGAVTVGNSVLYGAGAHPETPSRKRYDDIPTPVTLGDHEMAHTRQYTNPFFLRRYIGNGIDDWIHGKPNRYEVEADDFAEEAYRRRRK